MTTPLAPYTQTGFPSRGPIVQGSSFLHDFMGLGAQICYTILMSSIYSYLPAETVVNFIKSVRKAIENHPNPASDPNLKEMKRLAEELEADARRQAREREAEARRQGRALSRKREAEQRRENARVANRKPGDFSSRGLIGFDK